MIVSNNDIKRKYALWSDDDNLEFTKKIWEVILE